MEPVPETEALEFLIGAQVAHIGVVSDDEPYVSPVSFVVDGNRILFRTKPGKRFEAIRANPVVSVEACRFDPDTGDWMSVIVKGRAAECTDEPTVARTVELLFRKYEKAIGPLLSRGEMQAMGSFPHVVEVSIEEITGMVSGRGFSFRTRPGRL